MGISEAEFEIMRGRVEANRRGVDRMEVAKPARKHKYGVAHKEERTVGLLTFASKAEAQAYSTLLILQQAGDVVKLELQPVYKFPMGYEYRGDFRVTYKDGTVETIDVKGMETPVFRLKQKNMAYFYPDVKLTLWKGSRGRRPAA